MDFQLRGKCQGCRKTKWFIKTRKINLPIGKVATSKDLLCGSCYKEIKQVI